MRKSVDSVRNRCMDHPRLCMSGWAAPDASIERTCLTLTHVTSILVFLEAKRTIHGTHNRRTRWFAAYTVVDVTAICVFLVFQLTIPKTHWHCQWRTRWLAAYTVVHVTAICVFLVSQLTIPKTHWHCHWRTSLLCVVICMRITTCTAPVKSNANIKLNYYIVFRLFLFKRVHPLRWRASGRYWQ